MTIQFEHKIVVYTDDAVLCGYIEPKEAECKGWAFTPEPEVPLTADELRQIADRVDSMNGEVI